MSTDNPRDFPLSLLSAGVTERVKHFQQRLVNHTNLMNAYEKAMAAVSGASGVKSVIVTGPTGAGKSALSRHLCRKLNEAFRPETEEDPGMIPVIGFNAIPPNGNCFNWKDFYIRLLERHGDVLIDRKMFIPRQHELFPETAAPLPIERSTTETLRRAAERCMKLRKTKVLIIDEAHHILMAKDQARREFQFEALKSLSIESEVTIVLVGTYSLLDIRDQSGQLVRRSEIVHFPRYNLLTKSDAADFASTLHRFQQQLPLEEEPDLAKDAEYFFLKSGGCIGILKEWLTRCLEHAILRRKTTFDAEFAEEFALPNKSLMTIVEEAIEGELSLQDASLDVLKELMYRVTSPNRTFVPPVSPKGPKGRRAGRIGERKPVRDKVGVDHGHN